MVLVECLICGKELKRITNTHLKKHNLSIAEYKKKFPDSKIESSELAYNRVSHLRGKSYIEVYGDKKTNELKQLRKTSAINQFKNFNQKLIRSKMRKGRKMEESTKKILSEKKTIHGGNNYRKRALEFYGNICFRCGKKFDEKDLKVHHKDFNNLNYELGNHDLDNLVVLCKVCHAKLHNEINKTVTGFTGINDIEKGIHLVFKGLKKEFGLDLNDENFKDTPKRIARAYYEIFYGIKNTNEQVKNILASSFLSSNNEIVLVKDIRVFSMCPHHLLPVDYKVHVAYIPNGKVLGISKLARLAEILAKRPVLQEKFVNDVTEALQQINPLGAACLAEGRHYCMIMRGICQPNAVTVTSSLKGVFFEEESARQELMKLIKG